MDDEYEIIRNLISDINSKDEISLTDTSILMASPNYKVRFIAEYMQLKIRYNSLYKMLIKLKAGTLKFEPTCDEYTLDDQLYYMNEYIKVLEIRAEKENIELPKI
jgi:hypothetical protein